ncbi:hypothetical protein PHYSODRAFT_478106 [Phytophthora sojae]|uniref:Peptidase A2 domain-containing protein n=1 Tax=Phytophthora sojae (strain P6497) TaxID=1094619 RepID=G4YXR5_PHYSP|nr:hypothetical protein PHYSODRAFT_478106 [Phytophthora sojae]EGZ25058.1 hypothetical protein PHYSODRAFT_478106 [Phytophthora sojae]|eukprot:XP_009520346.1 hypothetical protein PHYSODRAFT_478106 [Phytophthora sojae]
MAEGRARAKITLAGSLVYFFDVWVGPPTGGQDLIIGMDFMVPAGIRLALADGTICLPDEVRIQLAGRRPLYGDKVEQVTLTGYREIDIAGSVEVKLRTRSTEHQKLWVTRGDRWVPTVTGGPDKIRYLQLTNVSDRELVLHQGTRLAMWLAGDRVPRSPGYVSVGSRRYAEWQNLAYQATTDTTKDVPEPADVQGSAVERPQYTTAILTRPAKRAEVATVHTECVASKRPNDSNPEESYGNPTASYSTPGRDEQPKNSDEFGTGGTRHDFATSQGAERPSGDYDAGNTACGTDCLEDQGCDRPQPV